MSAPYDHVMDAWKDFTKSVSKQWTGDGVISCSNKYQVLCICYKCCQHPGLVSSMALPWYWPAISHMTKWEKAHQFSSWNFAWACIYSSLMCMPLCPTLMNMLVTSPCRPYLIPKVDQSWCRVTCRIMATRYILGRRTKWLTETRITYSGFISHSKQLEAIKPGSMIVFPNFQWKKAASVAMQK